jgi:hypothetical protein
MAGAFGEQHLTEFQQQCEAQLTAMLHSRNRKLAGRRIEGVHEAYIVARISGTALTVFIYGNEAQIQGPGVDVRLEWQDYDGPDDLRHAFLERVEECLEPPRSRDLKRPIEARLRQWLMVAILVVVAVVLSVWMQGRNEKVGWAKCDALYRNASTAADSAIVDRLIPPSLGRDDPSRLSCGQLRSVR